MKVSWWMILLPFISIIVILCVVCSKIEIKNDIRLDYDILVEDKKMELTRMLTTSVKVCDKSGRNFRKIFGQYKDNITVSQTI